MHNMENEMNSISSCEFTVIVYEAEIDHGALNIDIVKKTLQSFNLDVGFKEVKQNWTDELNGSVNRLVFIVSADTYLCEIKRTIRKFSERNNNAASRTDIEILVIIEDDDDDDDDDDDFGFDYEEDKEDNTIEVKKLNQVYEWWPFVLQFIKPKKSLSDKKVSGRKHTYFFLFNEDCRREAEWFKDHRDTLEKLGIRCLRREGTSKVAEDIYMKSSSCVVVYVNGNTNIDELKDKVRKAVACGCKIRLFLETANIVYADTVQYECHLTLSGKTIYAHWARLMKDLNIIDIKRREDKNYYSRTGDRNFRVTFRHVSGPVDTQQNLPVVRGVYSFESKSERAILNSTSSCSCNVM